MQFHILPDNGNFQRIFVMADLIHHFFPFFHINGRTIQPKLFHDDLIHLFIQQIQGNLIDGIGIDNLNDRFPIHIAEESDLFLHFIRHPLFHTAGDNIRMDPQPLQFVDAVLGRFCFRFAGSMEIRHEGAVNIEDIIGADFPFHLTDGFQKGLGLNIADGTADLGDHHIGIAFFARTQNAFFDLIGHMRNHLHRTAEIITATFFFQNGVINLAAGGVAVFGEIDINKTFIMTDIQIGFGAVVGDENFTVLIRAHGAGVDIDIWVKLLADHFQTAIFQNAAERRCGDPFSQRRYNTAGHKNKFCHFSVPLSFRIL